MALPGAVRVICPGAVPKLEKALSDPDRVDEATVTIRAQLAGHDALTPVDSLPAATTRVAPLALASSKTRCETASQSPVPPKDMLSTEAGVGFTPGSAPGVGLIHAPRSPPDPQMTAARMSALSPPHSPSTRRC